MLAAMLQLRKVTSEYILIINVFPKMELRWYLNLLINFLFYSHFEISTLVKFQYTTLITSKCQTH